jgi:S-disulfanyl-L-cysteine oxidoreductase SoxD
MSSWREAALLLLFALGATAAGAQSYPGIGRAATAGELAAWDSDVRPDFKGLPAGSGSVAQGMVVWESRCASCHGVFGESNEFFSPIVGGTSADDIRSGRVARLSDSGFPQRTTLMKLSTLSTLWDYIHRAMPWNEPRSLSHDEVYAVTAYILHLGGIVADDFVLSQANAPQVQQRLPNRNGMHTDHGLWPGRSLGNGGGADVRAAACMQDCAEPPRIVSSIPDFARDAHGNLADQNRLVGAQRGAQTLRTAGAAVPPGPSEPPALALAQLHRCTACHALEARLIGPSFKDIAARHGARTDAKDYLTGKIMRGGQGVWGNLPMPSQALSEADASAIAHWLAAGASPDHRR